MTGMSTNTNPGATQALLALCEDRKRWAAELSPGSVRALLAEGADVNARDAFGRAPLHFTVAPPSTKAEPPPDAGVVRALLEAGADPNARDEDARTPLLFAVPSRGEPGHGPRALEIIRLLRAAGATVPADIKGSRAGALRLSLPSVYTELLDAGAPIDVRDVNGETPLHHAVSVGDAPITEILLARGAEVNAIDGLGRTPLGLALRTRKERWVKAQQRTADFDAIIALLERAGGQPRIRYERSEDPYAPVPVPVGATALQAAAAGGKLSFQHEVDSAQEFITGLRGYNEPEKALALLAALRDALDSPPRTVRLAGPLELDRPFFHHGDLEVEGHLHILRAFAVTGNLIVHGGVADNGNHSLVNILGDVRCHSLYTDGELSIGGTLHARDVVLGFYNDHLLAAGAIHARVVIEDDHAVEAEIQAEHHFDLNTYEQGYGEGVPERLRELFVDELLDDEGQLDTGGLFARLRQGLPVFRPPD